VAPLDSSRVLNELANVGVALEALGGSIRRAASAALEASATQDLRDRVLPPEEYAVRLLWERLGPKNREFLYAAATNFEPGDSFTLDDVAGALSIEKGAVRARMMNLGRSLKALRGQAPDLWDVDWDDEARMNQYTWLSPAHRAVLRIVEG
jgi:hypothetical protein